jgi:hypothetical protein
VRDKALSGDKQYGDDLKTLAPVQGRLGAQVQSLVQRIGNRGVLAPGSEFEKTAQSLRSAAEEMAAARERLEARKAKEALPPEQAALMHLQRAEAAIRDVQVSFEQGAGGGGSAMNAEDLADLFELELDKLKNQYETVQRGAEERSVGNSRTVRRSTPVVAGGHPGRSAPRSHPWHVHSPPPVECSLAPNPAPRADRTAPWFAPRYSTRGYATSSVPRPRPRSRPPHRAPAGGARGSSNTAGRAPAIGAAPRSPRPPRQRCGRCSRDLRPARAASSAPGRWDR